MRKRRKRKGKMEKGRKMRIEEEIKGNWLRERKGKREDGEEWENEEGKEI